jgi:hypothetical protein
MGLEAIDDFKDGHRPHVVPMRHVEAFLLGFNECSLTVLQGQGENLKAFLDLLHCGQALGQIP